MSESSSFYLASMAAQVFFKPHLVGNPEDRFSRDDAHL